MNSGRTLDLTLFENRIPLLYCEGSAEMVIAEILLKAGMMPFPPDYPVRDRMTGRHVIQRGKVKNLIENYLQYDYGQPVTIVRLLDSINERFSLPSPYSEAVRSVSLYTRPEIEILAIIREGEYERYNNMSKRMKPSDYCKTKLGIGRIKQEEYLREYWQDAEQLRATILEYARLHRFDKGEHCLADLIAMPPICKAKDIS